MKAKLSERITVRLTFEEARRIDCAARSRGITPSELARQALADATANDTAEADDDRHRQALGCACAPRPGPQRRSGNQEG